MVTLTEAVMVADGETVTLVEPLSVAELIVLAANNKGGFAKKVLNAIVSRRSGNNFLILVTVFFCILVVSGIDSELKGSDILTYCEKKYKV